MSSERQTPEQIANAIFDDDWQEWRGGQYVPVRGALVALIAQAIHAERDVACRREHLETVFTQFVLMSSLPSQGYRLAGNVLPLLTRLKDVLIAAAYDDNTAELPRHTWPQRPDCEHGDCSDHYGDPEAWCLRCRKTLAESDLRVAAAKVVSVLNRCVLYGPSDAAREALDTLSDVLARPK